MLVLGVKEKLFFFGWNWMESRWYVFKGNPDGWRWWLWWFRCIRHDIWSISVSPLLTRHPIQHFGKMSFTKLPKMWSSDSFFFPIFPHLRRVHAGYRRRGRVSGNIFGAKKNLRFLSEPHFLGGWVGFPKWRSHWRHGSHWGSVPWMSWKFQDICIDIWGHSIDMYLLNL